MKRACSWCGWVDRRVWLVAVLAFVTACKAMPRDRDDDKQAVAQAARAEPPAAYYDEEEKAEDGAAGGGAAPELAENEDLSARRVPGSASTPEPAAEPERPRRMVVYHGWLRLAVHAVEETLRAIDDLVTGLGGYVESSTLTQRVLRVPAARYEEAIAALRPLGQVRGFRQQSWDITEKFQNLEARIENLRALEERYRLLLAAATTIQERLQLEQELRRIAQELRVLEEQRRYLAEQAAYATLTVDLEPIHTETAVRRRRPQPFEWVTRYGLGGLLES